MGRIVFKASSDHLAEFNLMSVKDGVSVTAQFLPSCDWAPRQFADMGEVLDAIQLAVAAHFATVKPNRIECVGVPMLFEFRDLSRFALPVLLRARDGAPG
jgi:hypothetical protein